MVTTTSNFNPYQAPGTPISDASLAPDTEFLFNDKVVADHEDGLFLIGGLSDKFLLETKRMADEYTARAGS